MADDHIADEGEPLSLEDLRDTYANFDPRDVRPDISYAAQFDWSVYGRRVAALQKLGARHEWPISLETGPWVLDGVEFTDSFDEAASKNPILPYVVEQMREVIESKEIASFVSSGFDMAAEIGVSVNWAPFPADVRKRVHAGFGPTVFKECNKPEVDNNLEPALPGPIGAMVTFRVPVSQLTTWDTGAVAIAIRRALLTVLKNRPSLDEAPKMKRLVPPRREFLLHCHEDGFQGDIVRFRLHVKRGFTYRQIAYLEWCDRIGKSVESPPKVIGREIPGESGVRESIQRIYEAIHLKPYQARRRRLDTPAHGADEYRCLDHGDKCSVTCPYLRRWMDAIGPTLPTPTTGKVKGEVLVSNVSLKKGKKKSGSK